MDIKRNYEYLLSDLKSIKGVGLKTSNLLKRKKINSIFDLLWKLPKSYTDRSLSSKIKDLKIDEIQTITIIPQKYSFPRVRNLPNRVLCKDETGEIDCVFFNSYEGYIRKILPIGKEVTISGRIKYFRNKYQLTNPKYISEDSSIIKQKHNTYSLTEGISEKVYNKIIFQIIKNLKRHSYKEKYLLSSVQSNHRKFEEKRYWRGPVWINCNWIIYQGLKNKNIKFAKQIKRKTINLVKQKGFNEYFSCKTGKGFGATNFSWTAALFLDLILENKND